VLLKKRSGFRCKERISYAKYYASEVAVKVSNEAVQIFGG
jgi:alkylation response protein AidB-like acyl-CoA dehydrogenase